MKATHIMTAMLGLSLATGCVEVKVGCGSHDKDKHDERESEERQEKHEEHENREKKEHKEIEEREDDEKSERGEKEESQAKLQAEAKISEQDARQTALAKVPNGAIKEGELERENGRLQWSFDMAVPGDKEITEVNVDAISGQVINISKEAPEDEKSEEKEK